MILAGGWWTLDHAHKHPSISDAYVGRNVVRIAPQVSGPIQQVLVESHQIVAAGDLLVAIDPASFELAAQQAAAGLQQAQESLAAANAEVAAAQAQLASADANADEARRHAERIRALIEKASVSKDDADSAEQAHHVAKDALESARAALVAAEANGPRRLDRVPVWRICRPVCSKPLYSCC